MNQKNNTMSKNEILYLIVVVECLVLAILCFVSPGNSIVEFLVMLVVTGLAVWFTREKKKPEN